MTSQIADYVRRQGNCEPSTLKCIDDDEQCPIWRVEVKFFESTWRVPPPKFWYVCPYPGMNLYRNDSQRPKPWLPVEEQDEEQVIDYIKSFHCGLMGRIGGQ